MKGMKLLAWFLFISCSHVLSSLALKGFFKLEYDQKGANLSRPIGQGRDFHVVRHTGVDGAVKLCGEKHEMDEARKMQKGKGGVYGGANIAHKPRPTERSGAPILIARPQQPFLFTKTRIMGNYKQDFNTFPCCRIIIFHQFGKK
ncbi:uncharacterized protein LOC110774311 [Prunus avium]|uniref:Uncharacterized protein LOC110774311 n=1 Tax=Prunus avium TaxID=42229 RepID=A0A6P5U5C6_PRUAV|nr:uncharacterized protein LOC110774311 [Prunus avium]